MPETAIQPVPAARALTCPSCGGSVVVRAAGYTVHVACEYCGSILDVTDPQVKLVTEHTRARAELEIPLGTRGTLRGVEWEVIGYLRRSENREYPWEEYLLFNPYHGYRWLVKVRGGWSFGEMLTGAPKWFSYDQLIVDGHPYQHFFQGAHAQVDYVLGEFYWRVAVGEDVATGDWVRPGFMLSREENAQEVSWTLSELIPGKEMKAAFGIVPEALIWPPLPHQPSRYGAWLKTGLVLGGGTLAFLLALAIFFGGSGWSAAGTFPIGADGKEQTATLGPIPFNRPYQSVEIRADVPALDNGWVDLDYSLVDRKTQQVYTAYGAAERYSGSDSDGPWTEGSKGSDISIASVPAGSYDLVVDYKGNKWTGASGYSSNGTDSGGYSWMNAGNAPQVSVEVRSGVIYFSNLLIALILIALPLLLALGAHFAFETARKAESDFAPVSDDDEDDDG